ncbi:MAG: NFYB/HAP3 family transcription factor subunit [Candidatus Marsarchaeota archaeon]|jgi:Histones H3 and H4|nr:NFYB/HAP3 family transcription factor subunit [Candidatus Marsarchaeota archaeon]
MYISTSTIKRILKEAGAERVSNDAIMIFHENINKFAYKVATRSVKFAKHAKRKTVDSSDIRLAMTFD